MAFDSVDLNLGVGGQNLAADQVGGNELQIMKLSVGVESDATLVGDSKPAPCKIRFDGVTVGAANPLPVEII